MMQLSHDAFLCGRLHLWQPVAGYRAATDAVLLAAACPAAPGQSVLDLGCGVGAASLCLAARVPDLHLAGLEVQAEYADLARRNAAENGFAMQVETGDLAAMPRALRRDFDHVIANPPYYPKGGTPSPDAGRATALQVGDAALGDWVRAAARRLGELLEALVHAPLHRGARARRGAAQLRGPRADVAPAVHSRQVARRPHVVGRVVVVDVPRVQRALARHVAERRQGARARPGRALRRGAVAERVRGRARHARLPGGGAGHHPLSAPAGL